MATLIVAAVAAAFAPSTGASVGSVVAYAAVTAAATAGAAYVDQTYVYPLLQKKQDIRGPRIDDLPMQTSSEGSGMHYSLGKENRLAGTIIWMSDLITIKNEADVEGGKGGGGGAKQISYDYYLDVAIGLGEGPIEDVDKIWADSKLIYDSDGQLQDPGTASGYTISSFQPIGDENINITGGTGTFKVGDLVKFSGSSGIYKVAIAYPGGAGTLVIETPGLEDVLNTGDTVELLGRNGDGMKDPRAHLIRIYRGTGGQAPDSIIEGYMGAGNVPGFRDTAYAVISGLLLRDFGNRCPQFTFLLRRQTHESCAAGISNIMERSGFSFDLGEYVVDDVSHSIRGYTITGLTNGVQSIEPLLQAYDVLVTESNSTLRFFDRGLETIVQIYTNDLNASEGGKSGPGRPFTIVDPSGFDLPREVNVRFLDPTVDWQSGNARYSRNDSLTNHVEQLDVPLVMHPSDAANLAATRLWRSYAERMQVEFTLPPKYLHLEENDIAELTWEGEVYSVRLNEVSIGANHMIACKGLLVGISDADETIDCGRRLNQATPISPNVDLSPVILDVPAISDDHVEVAGVYVAVAAQSARATFVGAGVFASNDGTNFNQIDSTTSPSKMGRSTTILADGTAGLWDLVNTVTVTMIEGDLESATEDRVLNGANRAWLGQELIAYQTATQVTPKVWALSGLLRGLRSTSMTEHFVGEQFVVLNRDTVSFQSVNNSTVGTIRYFKFVQQDQTLGEVPTWGVQFRGNTLRQPAPIIDSATRDGSNDLAFAWTRRTRYSTTLFSSYVPLGADTEKYEIDFFQGATLKATKTSTSPSYSYTAAARATDGFSSAGTTVRAVIYMINEKAGRGYPVEVSI